MQLLVAESAPSTQIISCGKAVVLTPFGAQASLFVIVPQTRSLSGQPTATRCHLVHLVRR
jgi:hypothetical protein